MRAPVMIVAATAAAAALGVSACTATVDGPRPAATGSRPATPGPTYGLQIVHFGGYRDIRFGDRKRDLALGGEPGACGPQLTATPELSPVFDGDRLVLIWVNPPYRTPEGLAVGSAVADITTKYPDAEQLTPPPGSYVFPGLLVTRGDRAYLFLHDRRTVQKTIVGYTEHARRLYTHGFGQC